MTREEKAIQSLQEAAQHDEEIQTINERTNIAAKIMKYLPFYLGCEVVINTEQKKKAYLGGVGQFGDAVIIFESLGGRQTHGNYKMEAVKPVLRKVETITNDEVKEVAKFLEGGFTEDIDNEPSVHKYFFTPEAVVWYLKKGFDLFGLIESGLAIDKTKLNSDKEDKRSVARKSN